MDNSSIQLRSYCYLDQLQPHYASFLGSVVFGDLPIEGMAALFIEVAPGVAIFRLVDAALKASHACLGAQVIEREFGLFEMHAQDPQDIHDAGRAILAELALSESDRVPPEIVSMQIIRDIDPHHGQIIHRLRRGSTLSPGETLLVVECTPAAYANLIANEAEKAAKISVVEVSGLGRFGRVWLFGPETEILKAAQAAKSAVSALQADPLKVIPG